MNFISPEIRPSEVIYKKIVPEDFPAPDYNASINEITPTEEGYISEQVKAVINFSEKNTVVLNAGVGQGKTHTILDIAKCYFEEGFVIVFAVPYKSLIDQYYNDLIGNERRLPSELIVDYRDITSNSIAEDIDFNNALSPEEASKKQVHLITVNSLLGNPGDEFITQSEDKVQYLRLLIERCLQDSKRVIFIFDEIHDSIHNFQQQYIFSLLNWHNVVHKIFCVSATYNEASKVVIKYLSSITEFKIQIIESSRIKFEFKQSDLFLLLYNKQHYKADDPEFISIFEYIVNSDKRINILSYSKTIAESLVNPEGAIGRLLLDKYGDVNLCIGNSNSVFDPNKCNVGTTFSTGINIRGNDSAFLVILPSRFSYEQRRLGVFSRGINTLIQALARIRDKSEIYIITPSPSFIINYSSENGNYTNNVKDLLWFSDLPVKERYFDINDQKNLIKNTYSKIRDNVASGIAFSQTFQQQSLGPSLNFPTLDDFILSDGEKLLTLSYEIFGKDLSAYSFWAAFNDQFINCRLKGITVLNQLVLKEGEIMEGLRHFVFNKFFSFIPAFNNYSSKYFSFVSDLECYQELKKAIFLNKVTLIKPSKSVQVKNNTNPSVEKYIIATVQLLKKKNGYYNELFYKRDSDETFEEKLIDGEYTIRDYLFSAFINAEKVPFDDFLLPDIEKEFVYHFRILYNFWKRFKSRYTIELNNEFYFEPNIYSEINTTIGWDEIISAILFLKRNDPAFVNKTFSFFQKLDENTPKSDFIIAIISFFKTTFFEVKIKRLNISGTEDNRRQTIEVSYQPPEGKLINLWFNYIFDWFDDVTSIDGIVESIHYSFTNIDNTIFKKLSQIYLKPYKV